MTFPKQDEPYQHGSTVLPGVPLPASAHRPAAPPDDDPPLAPDPPAEPTAASPRVDLAPPAADPAAPPVDLAPPGGEDPTVAAVDDAAAAPRGRHVAPMAVAPGPPRSRTLLLAALGLVLVLAAVAAFVWPGFLTPSDDGSAGALPSGSPTTVALAVTLATPATIDGLRRFTGAADKALEASVAAASVAGLSDPVSAVYGKGSTPSVQVIAWKAVSPPAEDTVTAAFTGFEGSTGAKVTSVREVTVAGLPGHMECGLAAVEKARTLQCFWADDASFGAVTVLSASDRTTATATAAAVRTAVETTG